MDTFNIGQLTKEMIAGRLGEMEDPCAVAAEVMERALLSALRNSQSLGPTERAMIAEVCHGAITGILLKHQSIPHGAVQIMRAVASASHKLSLDSTEMMMQAVRGIARVRAVASQEQMYQAAYALESEFMGAGEALKAECSEDATLPLHPKTRPTDS